jgi:fructokinase
MYLCCGDSLFDMFSSPSDDAFGIALDGHVGGSPLNVALGLARMGNHARFFTRVSTDMFGRRLAAFMDRERHRPRRCASRPARTPRSP